MNDDAHVVIPYRKGLRTEYACTQSSAPTRPSVLSLCKRQVANPAQPERRSSDTIHAVHDFVEGGARTHRRLHLLRIGAIIPTKIHSLAFRGTQLLQNHVKFCLQFLRDGSKTPFQILIVILRGQLLRPIQGFVDMASGIIQLAEHATWGLSVLHELAGGSIKRISEYLRFFIAGGATQMGEGFRQGHRFPERIRASMPHFYKLWHMALSRTS